jgi:hypothetical protein
MLNSSYCRDRLYVEHQQLQGHTVCWTAVAEGAYCICLHVSQHYELCYFVWIGLEFTAKYERGINVRSRKWCWLDTTERVSLINYKFIEVRKGAQGVTLLVRSVCFCSCIANSWPFWTITIKKGASIWNVPLHIARSTQYMCSVYLSDSFTRTVNYNRYLRHGEISIVLRGHMSTFVRFWLVPHREHSPCQLWRSLLGGKRKFYTNLQVTSRIFSPDLNQSRGISKNFSGLPKC